jgi:hypothetical protein
MIDGTERDQWGQCEELECGKWRRVPAGVLLDYVAEDELIESTTNAKGVMVAKEHSSMNCRPSKRCKRCKTLDTQLKTAYVAGRVRRQAGRDAKGIVTGFTCATNWWDADHCSCSSPVEVGGE